MLLVDIFSNRITSSLPVCGWDLGNLSPPQEFQSAVDIPCDVCRGSGERGENSVKEKLRNNVQEPPREKAIRILRVNGLEDKRSLHTQ